MKQWLFAALCILLIDCNAHNKGDSAQKLPIVKISYLTEMDTTRADTDYRIARIEYFLVGTDGFDSSKIRLGIDGFVREVQATAPCPYPQCNMAFFKESNRTKEINLQRDRNLIDGYATQHDLIFEYIWDHNKSLGVFQYVEGHIVNHDASIIIQDLPKEK